MEIRELPELEHRFKNKSLEAVRMTYKKFGPDFKLIWENMGEAELGSLIHYKRVFEGCMSLADKMKVDVIGVNYDKSFKMMNGETGQFKVDNKFGEWNLAREGKLGTLGRNRLMVAVKDETQPVVVDNLYNNMVDNRVISPDDPLEHILHSLGDIALKRHMSLLNRERYIPSSVIGGEMGVESYKVNNAVGWKIDDMIPDTYLFDAVCRGSIKINGLNG